MCKSKPSAAHSTAQGGVKPTFSWCKLSELEFKGIGTICDGKGLLWSTARDRRNPFSFRRKAVCMSLTLPFIFIH